MASLKHWMIKDQFYSGAEKMRAHFEKRFSEDPEQVSGRFVWDYWHVPNQYTLLRTPAYHYFPEYLYQDWHLKLVEWGRENLGCHDISPPWMSCYVDGCEQRLHADHPHGPWAFVFSLTPSRPFRFSGGETCIFRPETLSNWSRNGEGSNSEVEQMMVQIPSKMNRLVVFDPRLPHGVTRVQGPQDPRNGRLVIHGWFVQPRLFFKGPLSERVVDHEVGRGLQNFAEKISSIDVNGYVSLKLQVSKSGEVAKIQKLTDTLVGDRVEVQRLHRILKKNILSWSFGKAKKITQITVPIRFG